MTGGADGRLLTLADYGEAASGALDAGAWDFLEGGAGGERTLAANLEAFERVRLLPRLLAGVARPELGTRILGRRWRMPVGIAPMAYHTLAHPAGETATALAAGSAGVPLVVSTFAGRTFEEIALAASAPLWLQVYCFRDRSVTRRLIERAAAAGFEALVLTVDAPRLGRRLRDLRNGFRVPAGVGPANLEGGGYEEPGAHALAEFDATLDWSVIDWLRSVSTLPVLVKGIVTAADATRALAAGVDGLVVSNHGGRQLDGAPATLDVLPEIAAAVGGACPVLLDGGVRRGADVLAAVALGADAVLVGRPVLHALAVGREQGVADVLGILADELTETMILTGTPSVGDAGTGLVRLAPPGHTSGHGASGYGPVPVLREPVLCEPVLREPAGGEPVGRESSEGMPGPGLRRADLHASVSDPVLDTMNFLNEITHRYPDALSFAPGRPYDGFFETEQIFTHLRRYLEHLEEGGASPGQIRSALFQYGPTSGQIRELVAQWLRREEDVDVPPQSVVVTVGAQEAMFLAVRALISGPDDVLLVSSPCYVGITGAARVLDVPVGAVAEGADGFSCTALEAAILAERARGRRPRAFYVIPDHSNPSGATLTLSARRELLELAARHDILILEDSPYRIVSPGAQLPTLKSLDRERRVVHLGSLSKTLFPGARVGFVVADQVVTGPDGTEGLLADELTRIKSMITVNTPPVSQAVVAGMLLADPEDASRLRARTAAYYGDAMRVTLKQLAEHLPSVERAALGVRWNEPTGGFFLTLSVPFRADNAALTRSAEEFGVIWTPMSYFYPEGGGEHEIRLSVSYLTHEEIADGVGRLTRFIKAQAGA